MTELSISNVVEIQVIQSGVRIGAYNTSNLAIITSEENSLVEPFLIVNSAQEVLQHFSSDSITYQMALRVFSQSPNLKIGGGYLVIIPMTPNSQTVAIEGDAVGGSLELSLGESTLEILAADTAEDVQDKLRLIEGFENAQVTLNGNIFNFDFASVSFTPDPMVVLNNSLVDIDSDPVSVSLDSVDGESVAEATVRARSQVEFFGLIFSFILTSEQKLSVAEVTSPSDFLVMPFLGSFLSIDLADNEVADQIRVAGYEKTRVLYHGDSYNQAVLFCASYASRALAVNFNGSNTVITMHQKDLRGVPRDPTMTQTLLNQAMKVGVDTYPSIRGVSKCFTSGANNFFDRVYNKMALVGDLEVAYYNTISTVGTKIPQTEEGMKKIKVALKRVLEKFVRNGFIAPGEWASPDTFGNILDFEDNIRQFGYFIFSLPLSVQSQEERENRNAPVIQIAAKEAGAIHKGFVQVNFNA